MIRYVRKAYNLLRNLSFSTLNLYIFYEASCCYYFKTAIKAFIISKLKETIWPNNKQKINEQWPDPVSLLYDCGFHRKGLLIAPHDPTTEYTKQGTEAWKELG